MTIQENRLETSARHGSLVGFINIKRCTKLLIRSALDFEVTESLPNVTFPLGRNWAGNIAVDRPGHPNDTLFFWAFEKTNGSLTANSTDPWGIWLNGGYWSFHSSQLR